MHANVRGSHHFNFHKLYKATRLAEHKWPDPVAEELAGVMVPGLESLMRAEGGPRTTRRFGSKCSSPRYSGVDSVGLAYVLLLTNPLIEPENEVQATSTS